MPLKKPVQPAVKVDYEVILVKLDKLVPNPRNSKLHDAEQVGQIAGSMLTFGWTDPIILWKDNLIIAGHGRRLAAMSIGLDKVPCIDCSHMTEADARAFSLAHNRIAENGGTDLDLLMSEMRDLAEGGTHLADLGFDSDEIAKALEGLQKVTEETEKEQRYTEKIESPIYEPSGEKTDVSELSDTGKFTALIAEIDRSDLPDDIAAFLKHAATRHIKFDFSRIAEFYAHAPKEQQELMEASALVVIDYDQAVEQGFVKLTKAVADEYVEISSDAA